MLGLTLHLLSLRSTRSLDGLDGPDGLDALLRAAAAAKTRHANRRDQNSGTRRAPEAAADHPLTNGHLPVLVDVAYRRANVEVTHGACALGLWRRADYLVSSLEPPPY